MVNVARSRDGREIVFETWGDPKGHPVFLLRGTPGSRNGPRPHSLVLYQLGIHCTGLRGPVPRPGAQRRRTGESHATGR
ncbi:hypothetical protein GCM10023083_62790 [Streptomyces phyllanthi]